MWLNSKGFVDRVRQLWSTYQFHGTPNFFLTAKLKMLKYNLKLWNKDSFRETLAFVKNS